MVWFNLKSVNYMIQLWHDLDTSVVFFRLLLFTVCNLRFWVVHQLTVTNRSLNCSAGWGLDQLNQTSHRHSTFGEFVGGSCRVSSYFCTQHYFFLIFPVTYSEMDDGWSQFLICDLLHHIRVGVVFRLYSTGGLCEDQRTSTMKTNVW